MSTARYDAAMLRHAAATRCYALILPPLMMPYAYAILRRLRNILSIADFDAFTPCRHAAAMMPPPLRDITIDCR